MSTRFIIPYTLVFWVNFQGLLVIINGFFSIPQITVCAPQIAKMISFSPYITYFSCNFQGLLVIINGFFSIAQITICIPQIAKNSFMSPFVLKNTFTFKMIFWQQFFVDFY